MAIRTCLLRRPVGRRRLRCAQVREPAFQSTPDDRKRLEQADNSPGGHGALWDDADGFFYDAMRMPDGTQIPNYGPNPRGMIMFSPEGRYSSQIMRDIGRPNFAANDRLKGTPDLMRIADE